MSLPEDSYGRAKRLDFIAASIETHHPRSILDIGCGAGTQLTTPLAKSFPDIAVVGIDEDTRSLAWARAHGEARNLRFLEPAELPKERCFDLVIASEVLEHVAEPVQFLGQVTERIAPGGRLILTVPNGYGTFEWLALAEIGLNLSGLQSVVRWLRGRREAPDDALPTTLANSPHVNFFSFAELTTLFAAAGLAVDRYRARTVLCGYLVDDLIGHERLAGWNARCADHLPSWCASDWMFELHVAQPPSNTSWQRGRWASWRKRLNERRWGIG